MPRTLTCAVLSLVLVSWSRGDDVDRTFAQCQGCYEGYAEIPQYPGFPYPAHYYDGIQCFPVDADCWQCDPDDPSGCHGDIYTDWCSEVSVACYYDGEEELAHDVTKLVAAWRQSDHSVIATLATHYPKSLRLNVERHTLQVYNCRGAVVGNLPVDNVAALQRQIAALTASAQSE